MVVQPEEFEFQAETKQLLKLVVDSLYTNREIFLRELISNASDAFDRLRFEALTNPEALAGDDRYEIRLAVDKEQRTLSVSDTGIGMSREEVIANIGTIAKSGSRELRDRFKDSEIASDVIGNFGVGFYSSFMVSDHVTLVTRRAGEKTATRWESTGDGTYRLSDAELPGRGTVITLKLKPVNPDAGIEDFTDEWNLSRIVRRYSDFIAYPIMFKSEREELDLDNMSKKNKGGAPVIVVEDRMLNSMKPIWSRARVEISDSDYADFYRHISHDGSEVFKTISLKAEGTTDYHALLFIPSKAPNDLFYYASECGLRLYAKRVMIDERCAGLLPRYLRFIKGVVDSSDLPLNISRQMLQEERQISQIRKRLTKKVLDTLEHMKQNNYDEYLKFWEQFGRALKEGVSSDYDNREKILSLLLFQSSNDPEALTSLHEYIERMKEEQKDIYYLTGESRKVVEGSPHVERLRECGYEVLYLVEPVDELLVQSLMDFEGRKLRSAGKGTIRIGTEGDREKSEKELMEKQEHAAAFIDALQQQLGEYIKQVRLSNRLVSSPACLVGTEIDYSPQLEKLLQKGKGGGPKQRRILELNPDHEIYKKMLDRFSKNNQDEAVGECAEVLFNYALLAEGSELADSVRFNKIVVKLMLEVL
jgi:molecular chaperone HtpG